MSSRRVERVSELAKQEISLIIQELNLTGCGFVTVTSVVISPDLKDGRVYVSVIGNPEQKACALTQLERRHGHIQHELAQRIVIKYTPRLKFILDETELHAQRIEYLLDELKEDEPS